MINWLLEQAVILTLITLFIYLCKPVFLKYLGARSVYLLWMLVPISLLSFMLPTFGESQNPVNQYMVTVKQASQSLATYWIDYQDLAVVFWALGVAFLGCLFGRQHFHFLRSKNFQALTDQETQSLMGKHYASSKGNLKVVMSKDIASPFIYGLCSARLALPTNFLTDFDLRQRQLILQHELTHLSRGDLYWNALAQLVMLVFWFNPVSWGAFKLFRQSQELACDQSVVAQYETPMRLAYAKAMLKCSEQNAAVQLTLINYGAKELMQERLKNLKLHKHSPSWKLVLSMMILIPTILSVNLVNAGSVSKPGKGGEYPIVRIEPLYPPQAEEDGVEGSVVLKFDIETDGSVSNVSVVEANPQRIFDRNAKKALRQWKYERLSKRLNGMLVQLDFRLSHDSDYSAELSMTKERERIAVLK